MARSALGPYAWGAAVALASLCLAILPPRMAHTVEAAVPLAPTTAPANRYVYGEQHALLPMPNGGTLGVRSLLRLDHRLAFGDYRWDEHGVPTGDIVVRVDLAGQTLSVFRGGHEIGTAVILYGEDRRATPVGLFTVRGKSRDHYSRSYDAAMPYALWLTDDGIALHGSDVRAGRATHGCIGLPYAFARRLFDAVAPGTPVAIVSARATGANAATG